MLFEKRTVETKIPVVAAITAPRELGRKNFWAFLVNRGLGMTHSSTLKLMTICGVSELIPDNAICIRETPMEVPSLW